MAGIFPPLTDGSVTPVNAVHGYAPTTAPLNTTALYHPQGCKIKIRPEEINALISEIECVIDKAGLAYDSTMDCNLYEAIKKLITAASAPSADGVVQATCDIVAPAGPGIGDYWVDTTTPTAVVLNKWDGTAWVAQIASIGPKMVICRNCTTAEVYVNCGTSYKKLTP